jgi:Secretion system C-terminal sorting domain/Outer membrane protein Omp28
MKKGLLFFAMFFATQLVFGQATRLVLVEEFTQASCPPCASQNPAFNTLLNANLTKAVSIKYQTSWPGYDPMNEQNPTDVANRVAYYGVMGVPNAFFDGDVIPNDCGAYEGAPACATQDKIDVAQAITSPIELSINHTISPDLTSVTFDITINNVSAMPFGGPGNFIRIALLENKILFPTPPGSTQESDFFGVMRKMLPDANGTAMPIALPAGQTVTQSFTFPLPSYYYNFNEVSMIAWVQNDGSKEVFQAAFSTPKPLIGYPDLAWERNTTGPTSLCEYSLTPSIIITNKEITPVSAFKVDLLQGGVVAASQDWTGTLAPGASTTVTFPNQTLPGIGEWAIDYNVSNIDGKADYNTLNNLPELSIFSTVSETPSQISYQTDAEGVTVGDVPAGSVRNLEWLNNVLVVNTSDVPTLTAPLGGFAASDGAILFNIYDMQVGVEAEYIVDKIDFTTKSNCYVKFNHSYRQYQAENDRLKVEVSKDCGATWVTVFNKAGTALKTTTPATARFFPQSAAVWKADSVALTAFAGVSDVLVKFHLISAFGNNLWIDNIKIDGTLTSGTNNPILEAATTISPNPTNGAVQISLNLPEAMTLTVKITDIAGKEIARIAENQLIPAGEQTLNFDQFKASGTYFVTILSENGQSTKRLTVVK